MRRFIPFLPKPKLVPVIRLSGTIGTGTRALNDEALAPLIEKAFRMKPAAVALLVNSPGGSPVQSRLIAKRIRDLADETGKPVLVFVEDAAASGGYFIATAGDEIIADPSSIVGSIGVIFAGFGFVEALEKLGVERRVHTAGRNKSTLDPFLPEKAEDVERIKRLETDIYDVFVGWVKQRRAGKLTAPDDELFTGEFWSGQRGLGLGLVDAVGDLRSVLQGRYGNKIELKVIAPKRPLLSLPGLGFPTQINFGDDLIAAAEDRTVWSRIGL